VKKALVLGSALCVWNDIEVALNLSEFDGVIAVKDAGKLYPGEIVSWVSLHPERFAKEVPLRAKLGYPAAGELVGHYGSSAKGVTLVDYKFIGQSSTGSSGLFGVKRAFELGFDKVVICGMPLEASGGKLGEGRVWRGSVHFRRGWEQALPQIQYRVRSMSGWTRQLLGSPTAEWLGNSSDRKIG
jgi:hypothetical protein